MSNVLALMAPVLLEGEIKNTGSDWLGMAATIIPFILIAVAFYFLLIRPQKKQEKEAQAMRNSIDIGDTITTIGGITGIVRQVKEADDAYIIETGADKVRISVKKWAVQSKDNVDKNKEKEPAVSSKEKKELKDKKEEVVEDKKDSIQKGTEKE